MHAPAFLVAYPFPSWRTVRPLVASSHALRRHRPFTCPQACERPREGDAPALPRQAPDVVMPATAAMVETVTESDAPAAMAGAQALLDDLAVRPEYYLNVMGVLLGIVLSVVVLSATMVALDSIPLVPDALRIVGLTYLFWFLGKFLLSGSERQRLQREVDEFVGGVKGNVSGGKMALTTRQDVLEAEEGVEKAQADVWM